MGRIESILKGRLRVVADLGSVLQRPEVRGERGAGPDSVHALEDVEPEGSYEQGFKMNDATHQQYRTTGTPNQIPAAPAFSSSKKPTARAAAMGAGGVSPLPHQTHHSAKMRKANADRWLTRA